MRFHVDESVNRTVASALRARGYDTTTATDTALRSASDDAHFEFARSENRVLVTCDDDFLTIAAESHDHPGIVLGHSTYSSIGAFVRACVALADRAGSLVPGFVQHVPHDRRRK
jgi:predicted nuclease of predicted toxin-antitoxin system